ncbi:ATP-binding protein [Spirulina subsalsa]|uniref:ATP-binding protein n=1 Tax=Spirulina subsalsa TaxID=54311 RepID=UPI0002ED05A0|nr:ATP-binding protein [Spirulina subsalsa]
MIFARYNRIIQITFVIVILVVSVLFYWQFMSQYKYETQQLKHTMREVVTIIDRKLENAENYVEQMQFRANSFYDISQITAFESILLDSLKEEESQGQIYYNLDHIPEPYSPRLIGNLTGMGTLQERSSEFYRELEMALYINPLLQTAFKLIPNTLWAYYLSENHFLNLYPWVRSEQAHFTEDLLTSQTYSFASPENNSEHHRFWSPVYLNPVTHQPIVTCGAPVYEKDQFRGLIALDFTLDIFRQILAEESPKVGHFLLFNEQEQIIAIDELNHYSEPSIISLKNYLPDTLKLKINSYLENSPLTVQDTGSYLLVHEEFQNTNWKLLFVAKKSEVITPILFHVSLGLGLILTGSLLLFFLVNQLIKREFINPASQLVEHIEACSQNQTVDYGDVPENWFSWFETIAHIFQENKKMTTELVQREKMSSLGQLVAGIAHEVNNPINFIYGNLNYVKHYGIDLLNIIDLYEKHYPEPPEEIEDYYQEVDLDFLREDLPKLLQSMEVGAERIREIVLSLRNFSRLDESDKKRVDLHHGLESTLMIVDNRLKVPGSEKRIKVEKKYDVLPPVECYAGLMNQVFLNVLTNAIDAVLNCEREEKLIKIETRYLEEGNIQVSIADNGQGIPESAQDHIFEPFFTTKPVGKGTGLGLSVSYQIIVDRHHGKLTYHSVPGEGTEFVITIPVESVSN